MSSERTVPNYVSITINIFFGRLLGCPKKWDFLKNGMNMVDVLAIMPYYVELLMSQQASYFSYCYISYLQRKETNILKNILLLNS
jgi:hypothetical protein